MEPYFLTKEDIKNFSLQGAIVGEQATDADLEAMGKINVEDLPPVEPTLTNTSYNKARAAGVAPENAPQQGGVPATAPTPSPAAGVNPLMGLLAQSNPIPQDPFENLSRNQRTMIGFAALKDAGMALQGKEGNAVNNVMKDITVRADMERKRQAAVAQQQMLAGLFGGAGGDVGGAVDMTSVESMIAHRAKLAQAAVMFPDRAAGLAVQIADLDKNIESLKKAKTNLRDINAGIAAVAALKNSPDLDQITGLKGKVNKNIEEHLASAPTYSTLMSYIDQIKGISFVDAFSQLKGGGPVSDMEGDRATAAKTRLERALLGSPEDLIVALDEVDELFEYARSLNPAAQSSQAPTAGPEGLSPDAQSFFGD